MEPRKQAPATPGDAARKAAIIDALRTFMNQRPGLEFGNYGDVRAYRSELRGITKDLHHARELMRAVELSDSITADDLLKAAQGAFSGRLTITAWSERPDGKDWREVAKIGYCTGQYWPTEYRRAVCAVLASALWTYMREHCMPPMSGFSVRRWGERDVIVRSYNHRKDAESFLKDSGGESWGHVVEHYAGRPARDWLRAHFRQQFGRGIASRWFS